MKVHELIEELKKHNQDHYVIFGTKNRGYLDIEEIDGPWRIDTDNNCDWMKDSIILTNKDWDEI